MTESEQPFLSRRQRREAERLLTGDSDQYVAEQSLIDAPLADVAAVAAPSVSSEGQGGIPSRKELRRLARETGVIPMLTAEMLDQAERGVLDIEQEIRHHTGTVPTLPADVVVGVDEPYVEPAPGTWSTGSVAPISNTENLDVAMPQWPSGSVPAIDDEVKKMEERALTGDLTGVAEALAAQQAQEVATPPASSDPIAAAWASSEATTAPRALSFDEIINASTTAPAPVVPEPVDETPVAETPVVVEPQPIAVAIPEPVIEPEPVVVVIPEPIVTPDPVVAPEQVADEPEIEIPAASPEIPPAREGDWREQLEADNEHEWVKNHETGMGVVQSETLQTLVVD
ncbi:MAG: hypothetical protein ACKOWN_03790, partial [Microbacteriaceae bacterium]